MSKKVEVETQTETVTQESVDSSGYSWLDGVPFWVLAAIRAVLGICAAATGALLAFTMPEPNLIQASIISGLFAFGLGMLSAFFMGTLTFRQKNKIIATGSFALFLILLFVLRSGSDELSLLPIYFGVA